MKECNPDFDMFLGYDLNFNFKDHSLMEFQRVYVCLKAQKKRFLNGFRPFIGIDGFHLEGPYRGVLLSIVGLDGNIRLFLVVYAIVEAENSDNWRWFLYALYSSIKHGVHHRYFCIMPDR